MAIIEIDRNPSPKVLRWFGVLLGLFFLLVGGVLYWRAGPGTAPKVLFALAGVLPALYYLVPPLRRPMYLGWIYLAWPIGIVLSFTLLAVIYYLVLTPIGLVMRLFRRDPMQRGFDANAKTYWITRTRQPDPERYFRPY